MTTTHLDLGPPAAEVARVVAGVRDEQLTDPTPCAGTPVAGVLDHLVGLTLAFRLAADKQPVGRAPRASADHLVPDWRVVVPRQLQDLVVAWRNPAARDGTAAAGGVQMPAPAMALVALTEVLVHGWDVAVATGQPYRVAPDVAEACLQFVKEFAGGAPEARNAMYGPVVPVPADAPVFDRLLGETGRDPGWTPS
jgi:uncharacterized protein (TIGR03086 family)